MGVHKRQLASQSVSFLISISAIVFTLCSTAAISRAQDETPQRGTYPGGSFALGQIETINTTNGNLLFNIPLVSLPPGRGGLTTSVNLTYNSKLWDADAEQLPDCANHLVTQYFLSESSQGGWRYSFQYEPELFVKYDPGSGQNKYKLQISFPGGSSHVMHPLGAATDSSGYYFAYPTNTSYLSSDGTYFRAFFGSGSNFQNTSWTIYFNNGTHVTGGNAPQRIYDRNNNYIEFQNTTWNSHPATKIVDQLNRFIIIEYGPLSYGVPVYDYVYVWGVNNQELKWTIKWKTIQVNKTYRTIAANKPCETDNLGYYLIVADEITPPSQSGLSPYRFSYNAPDYDPNNLNPSYGYGEVSSVTLPSGAQASYTYYRDGVDNLVWREVQRNRPTGKTLFYNQEYDGASTPTTETWTYGIGTTSSTITGPDGDQHKDYFYQFGSGPIWDDGLVYKSEKPDGTVIERIWQQNLPYGFSSTIGANAVLKTEFTSIKNGAGSLSKTAIKDYNYDKNGNLTRIAGYDWVDYSTVPRDGNGNPTGIPAATLKRLTTSTYSLPTPDASDTSSNSANSYWNTSSPNLRSAVASAEVSNGATTLARTESFYDNAATTGNLTQQKSWDSTKGGLSNPLTTANSVSVSFQYDGYGNRTLSTDARGYQTQFQYLAVGGFTDLYPTQIKAAYQTSVQRTESREYDFPTGAVTRVTDSDNNVSTSTAHDAFGRPLLVRAAENKPEETRTATEYADAQRRMIVRADLNTLGDGKLVIIQHYDQLGRIRLTRRLEDSVTQSATDETTGIKVQTRYKYSGSNSYQLVSNPYRASYSSSAGSEVTMAWTRTKSDNGGRVIEVQTFGGSDLPSPWGTNATSTGAVATAYDGEFTTVTDQMSSHGGA